MFLTIVTFILYLCAAVYTVIRLKKGETLNALPLVIVIALAILCHSVNIYQLIFTSQGVNLSIGHAFSLVIFVINLIVLISSLRKPLNNIFLLLLPLSLIALIVAELSNSGATFRHLDMGIVMHILLSIIAYSLISITALQALLLHWQNKSLKQRQLSSFVKHLPPLQTMETLMFELLWVGLIMLTTALFVGALYIEDMFAQNLAHKTILSIVAWAIFTTLLFGRVRWGWRGNQAIRWVLCGFCCLMLAYFGSKLALEVFLV